MAKTHDKQRVKGKESKNRNKSSQFLAHLKVHEAELVQEQATRSAKAAITTSTCQEKDLRADEEIISYNRSGTNWSQIQYRDSSTEEEEVVTRNITKVIPYQLQQWMIETSSPNITLGERLEKSKWKYESADAQEDLDLGEADEDWGRKPYDWILFSD